MKRRESERKRVRREFGKRENGKREGRKGREVISRNGEVMVVEMEGW